MRTHISRGHDGFDKGPKLYFTDSQIPELKCLNSVERRKLKRLCLQMLRRDNRFAALIPVFLCVLGCAVGAISCGFVFSRLGINLDNALNSVLYPLVGIGVGGFIGGFVGNQWLTRKLRLYIRKLS